MDKRVFWVDNRMILEKIVRMLRRKVKVCPKRCGETALNQSH
jgi:hypothetical protein